ncbi:MAG: AIR synthase-related protein, partial [Planctomycetota bacterium]
GMPSTGLHTNGYTLARKVLVKRTADLRRRVPDLGMTLADALLAVHRSYGPYILPILKHRWIKALCHITGGGFQDNLPRILPKNCDAVVETSTWEVPPLFRLIAEKGKVSHDESYRVFNMGMGLLAVTSPKDADRLRRSLARRGLPSPVIGSIVKGRGRARLA